MRMAMQTCHNCGATLRPQSRFCPKCATPVGGPPGQVYQPPPGYTARTAGPPPIASPRPRPGAPPRGTVVKEGGPARKSGPGTVLYEERNRPPVLGWIVVMKGKQRGLDFRIDKESVVIGREEGCD